MRRRERVRAAGTKLSGYTLSGETCGAFPKLPIAMRPGYCAGLVASKEDGLIFPRTIVQVPDTRFFVVVDMGGWDPQRGRVLLLDPDAPQGQRIKVLLSKLDMPHGLGVGPDRRIYVGTADKIFRFDPLAAQPAATVETILQGLPGRKPKLSDGTVLARNAHPLKHFVFDRTGRLFVNIGAPSDSCATGAKETKPCAAGEGAAPLAAVWMFTPPAGGIFPALRPGDTNPPHEVFARGLRNSMALAAHPRFPDDGFALLQGENARDLPDADKPNEEINALERGKHYGWPYCYDLATVSPEYAAFLKTGAVSQSLQRRRALPPPHSLLPPHGAPLGMLYYEGDKFPELSGKLIVGLHGYRPTGSRIVYLRHRRARLPADRSRRRCATMSAARRAARVPHRERSPGRGRAADRADRRLAQGERRAPARRAGRHDGRLRRRDLARRGQEPDHHPHRRRAGERAASPLPCGLRTPEQISELVRMVLGNAASRKRLTQVRTDLIERHCIGCHSGFDIKPAHDRRAEGRGRAALHARAGRLGLSRRARSRAACTSASGARAPGKSCRRTARELLANEALSPHADGARRLRRRDGAGHAQAHRRARRRSSNRAGKSCGSLPNQTGVTVTDAKPKEKPGFGRIYRPADRDLNGDCARPRWLLRAAGQSARSLSSRSSRRAAAQPLFESQQLTPDEYTFGIEGPAVDAAGVFYAVNFRRQGTIGKLAPGATQSELFAELPAGSIGVSIRFARGRMFVADYKGHNIFVFERGATEPRVYFHSDRFNQPNDMAIARDGTIYASDPHWKRRDGQVWRIAPAGDAGGGDVMPATRKMGTTNGIDLSPDERTLYVGESETREIWAYTLDGAQLTAPRLVKKFPDFSLDGLRTDIDGRIYVARILKGTIAVLAPDGTQLREIPLQAKEPTNLAFGGPDGKTVYVTQRKGGFIESFPRRPAGARVLPAAARIADRSAATCGNQALSLL